jgi:hypothetical protein
MDEDGVERDERFFEYDHYGQPLDPETRKRRALLREIWDEHARMSPEEGLAYLVKLGTHHPDGTLTEHYCDDAEPSICRPTDPVDHECSDDDSVSPDAYLSDERFFEYDRFGQPLDPETRKRRALLREIWDEHARMSPEEGLAYLVKLGTHNPDGTLTEHYRDDGEPSLCRPTD